MPEIVEKMTRIGNTAVHAAQEENRRKGIPNVLLTPTHNVAAGRPST